MHMFDEEINNVNIKSNLKILCVCQGPWYSHFNFIDAVKAIKSDVYNLYIDIMTKYRSLDWIFEAFFSLMNGTSRTWVRLLNPKIMCEYVTFRFYRCKYVLHKENTLILNLSVVFKVDWLIAIEVMKQHCTSFNIASLRNWSANSPPKKLWM
jgi:hypothetical protein